MTEEKDFTLSCPVPLQDYPQVLLAHGGGGTLMHQLIQKMFVAAFGEPNLQAQHDSAVLPIAGGHLAFTTDSYVVAPLFFPGGNIGQLAVHGTVNDLAMAGAKPLYLSVGFILEEGLPMQTLWQIVQSMQQAASETGVQIVTGDTKVVDKGKGDGMFINTAGIGVVPPSVEIAPSRIEPGDAIVINGDLGRHGMAIMSAREDLGFASDITSDLGDLSAMVQSLLDAGIRLHCLRDLTRGGLVSALCEIAESSGRSMEIREDALPVNPGVQALGEVLGIDPMHVANEGRLVAFLPRADVSPALEIMRATAMGQDAVEVGTVQVSTSAQVILRNRLGGSRILTQLSGEQLPRIC
jgi:hydrogenase expression/formation protein HypE